MNNEKKRKEKKQYLFLKKGQVVNLMRGYKGAQNAFTFSSHIFVLFLSFHSQSYQNYQLAEIYLFCCVFVVYVVDLSKPQSICGSRLHHRTFISFIAFFVLFLLFFARFYPAVDDTEFIQFILFLLEKNELFRVFKKNPPPLHFYFHLLLFSLPPLLFLFCLFYLDNKT